MHNGIQLAYPQINNNPVRKNFSPILSARSPCITPNTNQNTRANNRLTSFFRLFHLRAIPYCEGSLNLISFQRILHFMWGLFKDCADISLAIKYNCGHLILGTSSELSDLTSLPSAQRVACWLHLIVIPDTYIKSTTFQREVDNDVIRDGWIRLHKRLHPSHTPVTGCKLQWISLSHNTLSAYVV